MATDEEIIDEREEDYKDEGRARVPGRNVNKRDFVAKFKFRNYATITVRVSRLCSRVDSRSV